MKKMFLGLFLVVALLLAAGVVSANPDEPVSSDGEGEVGITAVAGDEDLVAPDEEGEAGITSVETDDGEDFVTPDEEGEVGITSVDIDAEDGAEVIATTVEGSSTSLPYGYMAGGAAVVIIAAVAVFARKKARA